MKIESVEVIPMTKDSKWEEASNPFEVYNITTSFIEWTNDFFSKENSKDPDMKEIMDDSCWAFAEKQCAFMMTPTAKFGNDIYVAKRKRVSSLDGVVIDGPLYRVSITQIDDIEAGKIEKRSYINPETFEKEFGLWYPKKTAYIIRYGDASVV